jgi:hypothetical protein
MQNLRCSVISQLGSIYLSMIKVVLISIVCLATKFYAAAQSFDFEIYDSIPCNVRFVFAATEQPPYPKISADELDNILNREIELSSYSIHNGDTFYVSQLIDTSGNGICYSVYRVKDSSFCSILIKTINSWLTWTPAKVHGFQVEFQIGLKYAIVDDKIKTISSLMKCENIIEKRRRQKRH